MRQLPQPRPILAHADASSHPIRDFFDGFSRWHG